MNKNIFKYDDMKRSEHMAGSGDYRWIAEDEQTDVYGGF